LLGDKTAKEAGRLTLNPFKHIDPLWFALIFLIHFWWWKPVQVNPSYYKNPLKDELLVSLAGPFSNLLMAFIWSFLYVLAMKFDQTNQLINLFFQLFIYINIALAIFNLLPIYPLDWYRIIKFLKPQWAYFMEKHGFIFMILLLILIFSPGNIIWKLINAVIEPIYTFFIYIFAFILS
jgi:Zn-dependent protease